MMKQILSYLPDKFILPLFVVAGLAVGLGAYTVYASRAWTYATDDPAACVNCHIMAPSYASWNSSSHRAWATCNDCHVPHTSVVAKYAFKAEDGLYHAAMFTAKAEPDVIRPREGSYRVIMANCLRCHEGLNTQMAGTGRNGAGQMANYGDVLAGGTKACWDCHREVPHTRVSGVASAPGAEGVAPLPTPSAMPRWLEKML